MQQAATTEAVSSIVMQSNKQLYARSTVQTLLCEHLLDFSRGLAISALALITMPVV